MPEMLSRAHPSAPRQHLTLSRASFSALQREELLLALVLTIGASTFYRWRFFEQAWVQDSVGLKALPWHWYVSLLFLGLGLLLALPTRKRSGLGPGSIGLHWKRVLLVCGGAVLATALVYPQLPTRPWANSSITMWLISPLAQSLFFIGYLYGRLEHAFPGYIHPRLPFTRALVLTVTFFAFWHLPNAFSLPFGYFLFQLFYTSVLQMIPWLSRQWTGSIWYAVLTHSAINFIAWYAS
jgi:membrane protease YdiL (CAAX protease family)